MVRPLKKLVEYDLQHYQNRLPWSEVSRILPLEAGAPMWDQASHDSWLKLADTRSKSELHRVIASLHVGSSDDDILRELIGQHGLLADKFFQKAIRSQVARIISTLPVEISVLRDLFVATGMSVHVNFDRSWALLYFLDHLYEQALFRLASESTTTDRLRLWIERNEQPKSCTLCGDTFRLARIPYWLYFGAAGFQDCCFGCRIVRQPRKIELHQAIPNFTSVCGFIPSSSARPETHAFTVRLETDAWPVVMNAYADMGGIDHVKKKFGTWFAGLVATGALPEGVLVTARGIRCLARDGHECHSLDEQRIDDWLSSRGIPHEREPYYPSHPTLNPAGRRRGDWRVGSTFIEYFGLAGDEQYDRKSGEKIILAAELGLSLIAIMPEDVSNLDSCLALLKH